MKPSRFSQVLAGLAARLNARRGGLVATIKFDLGQDGVYRLIAGSDGARVEAGDGDAAVTLKAGEQDMLAVLTGQVDGQDALQAGAIEAEGDLYVLQALGAALPQLYVDDADVPRLLTVRYPLDALERILLEREQWHPYPTIDDRAAWDGLPASVKAAYLAQGEALQQQPWPFLSAVRYLDFSRDGNRSRYETPYFQRRSMLIGLLVAECIENRGRFLDDIVNGIWLICQESSWCVPAHIGRQQAGSGLPDALDPVVDLFAAETSALLAWCDYLLGSKLDVVSPLVRPRLEREIEARVLTPYLERDDFSWMGFTGQRVNNWNPWINSNVLATTLLMERDPVRRLETTFKCMRSIDRFVGPYPADGGCDEGPGYWGRAGASLFDCLELLYSATAGRFDLYGEPLVREIGKFIYRVQIDGSYFVNFADASALVTPSPSVVFRYGQRIGDREMMRLGAWIAHKQDLRHEKRKQARTARLESLGRLLPALFGLDEMFAVEPSLPLPRDVWLPQIQVMVARDAQGSSKGLCVAAKGGHNAESHNHNDVGNFIVHVDGKPLIVDAGVETYTRKTFSAERYTIWTMQSSHHSLLPTVDGVMQSPGKTFAARDAGYTAGDNEARFTLDLAGAYPEGSKIARWQRTIALYRGQGVEIGDSYALSGPVGEISLSLLTPCDVDLEASDEIVLIQAPLAGERASGQGQIGYDARLFAVSVHKIVITDARLGAVWGEKLNRITFTITSPPEKGAWTFRIAPR